jgi:hypothetical protein
MTDLLHAILYDNRNIVSRKSIALSANSTHPLFQRPLCVTVLLFGLSTLPGCFSAHGQTKVSDKPGQTGMSGEAKKASGFDGIGQTSMFDGEKLGLWEKTDFYQAGNVFVKDGCLILEKSEWMTGVTWAGPLISMNYEIRFEAMRLEGNDFFCGLTFPVGKSSCSLILGGWRNQVSGLSTIDHKDASLNETTLETSLENNRWYKVTLRVTSEKIQASLDGEWIVDVDTTGKNIDIRTECIPSLPLGFATYKTTGAIRNIHLAKHPVPNP